MTCPSTGLGLSHHAENLLPPNRPDLEALLFQHERALDCQLLTDSGLPANGWLQMGKIIFHINTTLQGEKACCAVHRQNLQHPLEEGKQDRER